VTATHQCPERNPDHKHVVFISYNGLLDPLGASQILPYLERLQHDWPVHVVSFERGSRLCDVVALSNMRERMRNAGIDWVRLRYHKWPSLAATTFDLGAGVLALRRLMRAHDIGLVHARGYVPMAIATRATRQLPILFDIRGLQAEEYVDGGVWREGELKWRLAKRFERMFFRRMSGAVVLTSNIRPYVLGQLRSAGRNVPLTVIPCCVDLGRFQHVPETRERRRTELGIPPDTVVFVYLGSIGTWYLPDEMARFVRIVRDASQRHVCLLWIVNNDSARALTASQRAGLLPTEVRTLSARPDEVPGYLSAADAALALIKPSFSKRSSSPTKYAECLAMGLPLVIATAVGDGADIVDRGGGTGVDSMSDDALRNAGVTLLQLMREPREHFRRIAAELYDIDKVAVPRYQQLYQRLVQ
jgi:glycosyltransferase involved in cell wall biosynthesis